MKTAPTINFIENEGYATLAAQGIDTFKEVYKLKINKKTLSMLDEAKAIAEEKASRKAEPFTITFGGEQFQINPHGAKGGYSWVVKNDIFNISILKGDRFNVVCRYSSAGLWQYGIIELRERLLKLLRNEGELIIDEAILNEDGKFQRIERGFSRVSELHYCFDFLAPEFDNEIRPEMLHDFVCKSGVKKSINGKMEIDVSLYMKAVKVQTITLGSKDNLQLQIYNKTDEIKEKSEKRWMFDVWENNGITIDRETSPKIWRVEVRFGKTYLKNRDQYDTRIFECLMAQLEELINTAYRDRRLTRPNWNDRNRERWPVHPLFTAVRDAIKDPQDIIPIGRLYVQTRDEANEKSRKGIAGYFLTWGVTQRDDFNEDHAREQFEEVLEQIKSDKELQKKIEQRQERYKFIDQPK